MEPDDCKTGMGLAVNAEADYDRPEFPHRDPVRARFDGTKWGFRAIEIVGAHLVNPVSRPWKLSRVLRAAETRALERIFTEPADARVVVGDFNSSPIWPLYRRVAACATDAAAAAGTARPTWGYFPWSPALLRIDHAFVQRAVPISTKPVRIAGSDHRALVIDLAPLED